ncbi:hypothetical protein PG984_015430 [Apiospora sp. TS-2023a]
MSMRGPVAHDREEIQGFRKILLHVAVGRGHSPATDGQNARFLCAVIEGTNDRIDLGKESPVEQTSKSSARNPTTLRSMPRIQALSGSDMESSSSADGKARKVLSAGRRTRTIFLAIVITTAARHTAASATPTLTAPGTAAAALTTLIPATAVSATAIFAPIRAPIIAAGIISDGGPGPKCRPTRYARADVRGCRGRHCYSGSRGDMWAGEFRYMAAAVVAAMMNLAADSLDTSGCRDNPDDPDSPDYLGSPDDPGYRDNGHHSLPHRSGHDGCDGRRFHSC